MRENRAIRNYRLSHGAFQYLISRATLGDARLVRHGRSPFETATQNNLNCNVGAWLYGHTVLAMPASEDLCARLVGTQYLRCPPLKKTFLPALWRH